MNKLLISTILALLPLQTFAYAENEKDYYMVFEVVQDQFVFDKKTVKAASIKVNSGGVYTGLHVELKSNPAKVFTKMTEDNINKHVNLVFNKKIINTTILRSSLGNDLLITGITKEEAQEFINRLSNLQPEKL